MNADRLEEIKQHHSTGIDAEVIQELVAEIEHIQLYYDSQVWRMDNEIKKFRKIESNYNEMLNMYAKVVTEQCAKDEQHCTCVPALRAQLEKYYRWMYAAIICLAKWNLSGANLSCGEDWPAGQSWKQLNNTSRAIFVRRARQEAGIPDDEFLEPIRSGRYDVEDLWDRP
jgi:uncharacterized membrane protein